MQVTRRRREQRGAGLAARQVGRRISRVTAGTTAVAVVAAGTGVAVAKTDMFGTDQVGQVTEKGQVVSSDQYIDPIGDRLVINNGKIMSSVVSPDGKHVAASITDGGMA